MNNTPNNTKTVTKSRSEQAYEQIDKTIFRAGNLGFFVGAALYIWADYDNLWFNVDASAKKHETQITERVEKQRLHDIFAEMKKGNLPEDYKITLDVAKHMENVSSSIKTQAKEAAKENSRGIFAMSCFGLLSSLLGVVTGSCIGCLYTSKAREQAFLLRKQEKEKKAKDDWTTSVLRNSGHSVRLR